MNSFKKMLLTIFYCSSLFIYSQTTFNVAIGGTLRDQAISAEPTFDGGYVVVGWTQSYGAGSWDIYLVKTSSTGNIEWTKTYGGAGDEVDCYVHQTFEGGYIITARSNSFGAGSADVYLIKADPQGDLEWTKTIGGTQWDEGHSVVQNADSSYTHIGYTTSFGAGDHDCYLIRSDKNGNTLWTKSFGGPSTENGHLIIKALDGGYIVLGETTSFGVGNYDYYLIKTDVNGNLEWSKTYGGLGDDHGWDIKTTKDSCYVLAGYTNSFGAGEEDAYLIKIDSAGNVIWARTYGNVAEDNSLAVRETVDGGFILAGETVVEGTDSADVYLIKTDAYGMPEWSSAFGGNGDEGSQSVYQTADKGYFISGYVNSFGQGDWDFYLIKTDSSGQTGFCNLPGPSTLVYNATSSTLTTNPITSVSSGDSTIDISTITYSGGIASFCTATTSLQNFDDAMFRIFPNPGQQFIDLIYPEEIMSIEIYDQTGQIVHSEKVEPSGKDLIDISKLKSGVYQIRFFSLYSNKVQKFVKID